MLVAERFHVFFSQKYIPTCYTMYTFNWVIKVFIYLFVECYWHSVNSNDIGDEYIKQKETVHKVVN